MTEKYFQIPEAVIQSCGPFEEWKQDASYVSVELKDGRVFGGILVIYPNYIAAVMGFDHLPFEPSQIVRAFQSPEDLKLRGGAHGKLWPYPMR